MKKSHSQAIDSAFINNIADRSRMVMLLVALLVFCSALAGYNLYVDLSANPLLSDGSIDYPFINIQDAIDHAFNDSLPINQPGTSVLINVFDYASGYHENLNVNYIGGNGAHFVSDISIQSISNDPEDCALIGLDSSLPVITIKGNNDSLFKLKGISVKHSTMVNEVFNRGILLTIPSGSYGYFNTLDIDHCRFDNNHIAVEVDGSIVTINNLKVTNSVFNLVQHYYGESTGIKALAGGNGSNAYINGNEFTRTNPNIWDSESVALGGKFVRIELNDNLFSHAHVSTSNNFNPQDVVIRNNDFQESSVQLTNYGDWQIDHNKFVGLSSSGDWSAIMLCGGIPSSSYLCAINENIFFGCFQPLEIQFPGSLNTNCIVNTVLNNNSFINCGGILSLQRLSNMQVASNSVSMYRNNLNSGTSNAPFIVIDQNNNPIELTGNNRIPVSYSHFSATLSSVGSLILDTASISYGNPYITIDGTSHTYSLNWDNNIRSPLIMTGYGNNGLGSQYFADRLDIGAVQYNNLPHEYINYQFLPGTINSGIKWMSFPTLDRLWNPAINDPSMAHTFFNPLRSIHILDVIKWKPTTLDVQVLTVAYNGDWQGDDHEISPTQGYIVDIASGQQSTIGISVPGMITPEDTQVELQAYRMVNGQQVVNENWIGYFVKKTLPFTEAFSEIIDNLHYIQTQNWTASRKKPQPGSPWIVALIHSKTPTLSYGEMAIVKCFNDANFVWNSAPPETEQVVKKSTIEFIYTEKPEYMPIYVDISGIDMPKEIGIFIDNVCKGAAVVTDSLVEIPAYILDVLEDNPEIEFRLYYDSKAVPLSVVNPMVWDDVTENYNTGNFQIRERRDYYKVSISATTTNEDLPPIANSLTISPNPFNPSTNIRYYISSDYQVNIDIYNVKGQRVNTLVEGFKAAGDHTTVFNGRDFNNRPLASGIYFATLKHGGLTVTRKMILMK